MKFSEEQIETAIANVYSFVSCEDLSKKILAELTKPEWIPEVGQVVSYGAGNYDQYAKWFESSNMNSTIKNLTLTEHGPDVEAIQTYVKQRAQCGDKGAMQIIKAHEISDD